MNVVFIDFIIFRGGAELLFGNKKNHSVTLPEKSKKCKFKIKTLYLDYFLRYSSDFAGNLGDFLLWVKENLLQERPELFIQGESV